MVIRDYVVGVKSYGQGRRSKQAPIPWHGAAGARSVDRLYALLEPLAMKLMMDLLAGSPQVHVLLVPAVDRRQ